MSTSGPGFDRDGHLTELGIDRLLYGDERGTDALARHAEACERCREVLDRLRREDAATVIPLPPPPARDRERSRTLRRVAVVSSVVLAAAAALVLVARPGGAPGEHDTLRARGGGAIDLTVYVHDGSASHPAVSGSKVRPGDRARFEILPLMNGFVMVVGMDDSGVAYAGWPQQEDPAAVYLGRSADPVLLPTAIEFDATPGAEHIFAVWCDHPFALSEVATSIGAEVAAPGSSSIPGCELERVDLTKEGR